MANNDKILTYVGIGAAIAGVAALAFNAKAEPQNKNEAEVTNTNQQINPYQKQIEQILKLLEEENYTAAVFETGKLFADVIRDVSGIEDKDGVALIDAAFGRTGVLQFNVHPEHKTTDTHDGYYHLCRGAFAAFRNPAGHISATKLQLGRKEAELQINLFAYLCELVQNHTIKRNK